MGKEHAVLAALACLSLLVALGLLAGLKIGRWLEREAKTDKKNRR